MALTVILGLLLSSFGSTRIASPSSAECRSALIGGSRRCGCGDIPLSISAGVGFIALSGVVVLNGLVMVGLIRTLRERATPSTTPSSARSRAIACGARYCDRRVARLPADGGQRGPRGRVQRPLATVVIGGIVSSTLLTLLVLPGLYRLLCPRCTEPSDHTYARI